MASVSCLEESRVLPRPFEVRVVIVGCLATGDLLLPAEHREVP